MVYINVFCTDITYYNILSISMDKMISIIKLYILISLSQSVIKGFMRWKGIKYLYNLLNDILVLWFYANVLSLQSAYTKSK